MWRCPFSRQGRPTGIRKLEKPARHLPRQGRGLVRPPVQKFLYRGLIHPHLKYGLPIWGHATWGRITQSLVKQKKAIQKVYYLPYHDHTLSFFITRGILQMPELITHSTICCIHSGTLEKSPSSMKSLWTIKAQSEPNHRDRGIVLDYKVCSREWINHLPDTKHARIWNSQNHDVTFLNAKPGLYKVKSKF